MPDNKIFRPMQYICPICGERTTFGSHFCKGEKTPREKPAYIGILKQIGVALVVLVLITATLWDMIGVYSLYAIAAVAILALAAVLIGRSPLVGRGKDYRELVKLSGGDKEAAERLVAMEKLKRPGESRAKAIRAAVEAYRRDLR
jgi:hypothetical protein